ncbi:MAG: PD-(D/E)XK nuclease family protein [Acidimicrobiales bacterium]|nr:PD-(D/E)XK nuclease family protein [Acidimicrobiales bacterium]
MSGGERSFHEVPYNPAQQAIVELLGARAEDRPEFDPGLSTRLQVMLEAELWPLAEQLDRDDALWVTKHELSGVHGCEARHLVDDAFAWSPPLARGTVVHKAIELSVHWRGEPTPLELVDEATARLEDGGGSLADWLRTASDVERADLRSVANDHVAKFLECFPPLLRAWVPVTESRVRVELCDGRIVLGGKIDLSLGKARGTRAGKVLLDLKTGRFAPSHVDDLRYYALVETIRLGTPPRLVASYYLDEARAHPEVVNEAVLDAAVARTVDGARRLFALRHGGAEPSRRPGPACRWCPLLDECEQGQAHHRDDAD